MLLLRRSVEVRLAAVPRPYSPFETALSRLLRVRCFFLLVLRSGAERRVSKDEWESAQRLPSKLTLAR